MHSIELTTTRRRGGAAIVFVLAAALLAALLSRGSGPAPASAASHREAPLISLDPEADITDFFMFRSYEPGQSDKVDLIMDVIPGEEPSSGPNYFNFDPSVLYTFNVDNDNDGKADDIRFEFSFKTELRGDTTALGLPLAYTAIPPITHLDGPGSEGLGVRQRYTLTMVKGAHRTVLASGLFAVPSNVGPKTMPNYDALAAEGTYSLGNGIRVFAGQRDDPFYIDLGAVFDTLNLRNPGTDMLSGFNVHTIALEVPSTLLTGDTGATTIGAYSATSRKKLSVNGKDMGNKWVQVQRLANPLVNEVIIGLQDKDRWNATRPDQESSFLGYYLKPRLALALQLIFGANTGCTGFGDPSCSPNPPAAAADFALGNFNRTDLQNVLLKYQPSDKKLSELLRLNLNVPATPLGSQQRLTILAGDNAGWPNGRRPLDDVTDVAVQVVGGPNYILAGAGDAVNQNDKAIPASFPFLASPWDGRNRVHANP
jgi:Domain of unknown function (DUF4331)